jgi:hypothetical protein
LKESTQLNRALSPAVCGVGRRWPLVKKRKLEYMEWYQTGPGSWQQQRPKLLQLLEAMQQQGLYDPDAGLVQPDPAASAAVGGGAEQQQDTEADAEASSSSSSSSQQQPTVTGRPLGLLGIGWGSFLGLHAAGDDAVVAAGAKVLVALSPATYNKDYDLSCKLQLPVALLPAKYDSMEQVMMFINLLAKPWELRCIFKRFGKVGKLMVVLCVVSNHAATGLCSYVAPVGGSMTLGL